MNHRPSVQAKSMRRVLRVGPFHADLHEERGATILIAVVSMVALLGLAALVVDGGRLFVERRREVRAADAAALAAALTYAMGAPCGTQSGDQMARAAASDVAFQNIQVPNAATLLSFTPDCARATVTLTTQSRVDTLFSPVLGFPSNRIVHATATARWGIAGAGHAIPIMLRQGWVNGCIGVAPDFNAPGTPCPGMWLNNSYDPGLGDATWSFVNLNPCSPGLPAGWNVPRYSGGSDCSSTGTQYTCPNSGAGVDDPVQRGYQILNGAQWALPLNYPDPTYVCSSPGASKSNIDNLQSITGQIREFPINCPFPGDAPACQTGTHGQVDKNGALCYPCPTQPDKYDMVSFAPLQIESVLRGDDPAASGSKGIPSQSGHCVDTHGFRRTSTTFNIDQLTKNDPINNMLCPNGQATTTLTPGTPFVYSGSTVYHASNVNGCTLTCDYSWDPSTHIITWLTPITGNATVTVTIDYMWTIPGTPDIQGYCGVHDPDPNAVCLLLSWQGPQAGGNLTSNPGYNFGLRGIQLCNSTDYVSFESLDANGQPYCPRS
jgi:hypothetical protein